MESSPVVAYTSEKPSLVQKETPHSGAGLSGARVRLRFDSLSISMAFSSLYSSSWTTASSLSLSRKKKVEKVVLAFNAFIIVCGQEAKTLENKG